MKTLTIRRLRIPLLCALLLGLSLESASAQAFCALRDPTRSIYDFFPEADGFRSYVRAVNNSVRSDVGARLPFSLHFNELGKHTVYAAFADGTPQGLVHVRSERGNWGLVEVAWSFDLDMRVLEFDFQRCRDRAKGELSDESFRAQIRGMGFDELRALLNANGTELQPDGLQLSEGAKPLAVVLLRCGLKTIAATESGWKGELFHLRARRCASLLYGAEAQVEALDDLYPAASDDLRELGLAEHDALDRGATHAFVVRDGDGTVTGYSFRVEWQLEDLTLPAWLVIDRDGTLRKAHPDTEIWRDSTVGLALEQLEGRSQADLHECASPAELVTLEVMALWEVARSID